MSDKNYYASLGEAYVAGMRAAEEGQPVSICPYYKDTQQTLAFSSGHRDQMQWDTTRKRDAQPE